MEKINSLMYWESVNDVELLEMGVKEGPLERAALQHKDKQESDAQRAARACSMSGVKLQVGNSFAGEATEKVFVPKTTRITEMRLEKLAGARSRRILEGLMAARFYQPVILRCWVGRPGGAKPH